MPSPRALPSCLLLVTAVLSAQDLRGWDKDGDGLVTRSEFRGPEALFEALDRDADGTLAGRELVSLDAPLEEREDPALQAFRRRLDKQFAKRDADEDGRLLPGELEGKFPFEAYDGNVDGALSLAEFAASLLDTPVAGVVYRERVDADGDGRIARREWTGSEEAFAALDQDDDRSLDVDELILRYGESQVKRHDEDKSRTLSPDEWHPDFLPFAQADRDGDGEVSALEACRLPRVKSRRE